MSRYAAVLSLGTQENSFESALRFLVGQGCLPLDLFVLYGTKGDKPDSIDPEEILRRCKAIDLSPQIYWKAEQQCDSFRPESTYRKALALLAQAEAFGRTEAYDKVFTCIVGGTNPMIAALILAAQAIFPQTFYPLYVQGTNVSIEVFEGPGIRDDQVAIRALNLAHNGQYSAAAALASFLPKSNEAGFLREGFLALAAWDDFDYASAGDHAKRSLRALASPDEPRLQPLMRAVQRISKEASPLAELSRCLANKDVFKHESSKAHWPQRIHGAGRTLALDALANAQRRLQQNQFTDAVLRGYRACECATQMQLLELGIHPSWPHLFPDKFQDAGLQVPKGKGGDNDYVKLSFNSSLEVLGLRDEIDKRFPDLVRKIQTARNDSYLEHGYVRLKKETAEKHFINARRFCCEIFKIDAEGVDAVLARLSLLERPI